MAEVEEEAGMVVVAAVGMVVADTAAAGMVADMVVVGTADTAAGATGNMKDIEAAIGAAVCGMRARGGYQALTATNG